MFHHEFGVPAAGDDDDRGAGGDGGRREIDGERGVVDVGDVGADDFFRLGVAGFGAGGAVRPEGDDGAVGGGGGVERGGGGEETGETRKGGEDERAEAHGEET